MHEQEKEYQESKWRQLVRQERRNLFIWLFLLATATYFFIHSLCYFYSKGGF